MLTREQIFGCADIVTETVEVPEWKDSIIIRSLTAGEREQWESIVYPGDGEVKHGLIRATLIALAAVDDKGNRIFTIDDAASLETKSASALDRLYRVARRLSFIGEAAVAEIAKN